MITCYFENNIKAEGGLRHVTVSTLVIKEGKILLGKRGTIRGEKLSEWGKWGLLGGYFDRDETIVEAARREILEEGGCEITNLLLFKINDSPLRPKEDKQNVDFIFIADFLRQVSHHDEEVTQLKWFSLDALPKPDEIAFDHGENIMLYKGYLKTQHPLPIFGRQ